jgi:hypothetical protein
MRLSPEETEAAARELASTMVSLIGSVTAALAVRAHGVTGVVRQSTADRAVTAWLPITRRWAAEWQMGPWTAVAISTFAMAKEQWTCEAGAVAPDGRYAGDGVHPVETPVSPPPPA